MNQRNQYRSTGREPRLVRRLDFDRLPSAVQNRLVRCLGEGGAPAPLLSEISLLPRKIPGKPRWYTYLGIFAGLLEAGLWFSHFGDLHSNVALQPQFYLFGHSLAASLFCLSVLVWVAFRRSKSVGAPYPAGRFLFAMDLVETEGRLLSVTSLDSLRTIEIQERREKIAVELIFRDGDSILLPALGDNALATAQHAEREIKEAARLVLPDAQPKLERIDPFFELRIGQDWASAEARPSDERSLPAFRALVAMSLGAGVLFGPLLLWVRNVASDRSMYSQVCEKADSGGGDEFERAAYNYQLHGKRHKDDVDRVGFSLAGRNIQTLAGFVKDYPESRFSEEADDALFEKAKAQNTVDAWGLYLGSNAKRHRADADDALFAAVKKQKTVYAYQQYVNFSGTRHIDEIRLALLPEKEIAEAAKAKEVGLLLDIHKRYADTPWAEVALNTVHRIYQEAKQTLSSQWSVSGSDPRTFFEPLLSHAQQVLDPRVLFVVETDVPYEVNNADEHLKLEYGSKYHPAVPHLGPKQLEGARREVETGIIKAFREAFGGSLVLVAEIDEPRDEPRKEWPKIRGSVSPTNNDAYFISQSGDAAYCDIRLKLSLSRTVPGTGYEHGGAFFLTSEKSSFNPTVFSMTADVLKQVKPGDAYATMLKDAPASLLRQLTGYLGHTMQ